MTRYGKSYSVALGICLFILRNENKRIGIIAPTNEKTGIIRNYIADFVVKCPYLLDLLDINKKGIERIRKEVSRRRMTWRNGIEMRTLSAEGEGEQLMGFGFDKIIVDEECDIKFEVYRAKITRMLGDNPNSVYIAIGNPWHRDNQFWEHWTNPNWFKIHIGYETALKEGRITESFVQEQKEMLTDREFQILYKAEFPEESEDQLIKSVWIKNAQRDFPLEVMGSRKLGVDVARTGMDSTVLTYGIRTDSGEHFVKGIEEHNQEDTMQTVSRILALNQKIDFDKIIIDTNGLGAGVTDRMKEAKREGRVRAEILGFMGGQSSVQEFKRQNAPDKREIRNRFLNTKSEAYFKLRGLFEEGRITIPKHPKLIDQLHKMKWELTTNEKIRILDPGESEKDTAEQKSPDFADSLCYFCWEGTKPPLITGFINLGKETKRQPIFLTNQERKDLEAQKQKESLSNVKRSDKPSIITI